MAVDDPLFTGQMLTSYSGSISSCSAVLPQESSGAECHTDGMKTSKYIHLKHLHLNTCYKSCTYATTIVINLALC